MEIREIKLAEIHPNILRYFNRYQNTTEYWNKQENTWVMEKTSIIRDWNDDKKQWAIKSLIECMNGGSSVIGVFDDHKLVGFAQIDSKLFGSANQYVHLSLLMISNDYRNQGLGKKLFICVCSKARSLRAKKLYISAYTAKETIEFYKKMGCIDAQEIFPQLADTSCDWHMEYELIKP